MAERETRFLCTHSAVMLECRFFSFFPQIYCLYYLIIFQCGAHTKGAMLLENPIKYMVKKKLRKALLDMLYTHFSADSLVPKNRSSSIHSAPSYFK